MKILYAIQGTGNGHVARAREIVPLLQANHEVDVLISGTQADIDLPCEVRYRLHGLGFVFGKKGGVDVYETYHKNNLRRFFREINELPILQYDLVLNDFEPVSAWASHIRYRPCIGLSHQAAVLHKNAPQPRKEDLLGKSILKYYAPVTAKYGFHFRSYDEHIFTPVIRQQVRALTPVNNGHYTVYLPAYDDQRLLKMLRRFPGIRWEVFSKHNRETIVEGGIRIMPVNNDAFLYSMAGSSGVLCGAGFETPDEALFLRKKLMVVPMKGQYEQQCNAAALKDMGVPVIKSLKKKHTDSIQDWLENGRVIPVDYPDNTAEILESLLQHHCTDTIHLPAIPGKKIYSLSDLKTASVDKIIRKARS